MTRIVGWQHRKLTRHSDSLLEGNVEFLADALDLDFGVPLDGDAQGVVDQKPGVEDGECLKVGDGGELANGDGLLGGGGGRGEVNLGKRRVRMEILEVHLPLEAVDICVNGIIGLDRAVDGHGVVLGLGVGDHDALEVEFGLVKLLLGDLGHADEDTAGLCREPQDHHVGMGHGQ